MRRWDEDDEEDIDDEEEEEEEEPAPEAAPIELSLMEKWETDAQR